MMEEQVKVFSSKITRGFTNEINDLYELLKIKPATPVKSNNISKSHCAFQPKDGKYYEYKKKSKLKVNTVRDIRNLFEKDNTDYLPQSLENQRNILLKRIREGFSKDENTKKLAKNILKSDNPILRTSWQMLANINPEGHAYSTQYILWNGKNIRVCGSRGGANKYIYKYELRKKRDQFKNTPKKTIGHKNLLQNSLSLKIKPGPLTQKKYIDDSYQKLHVGNLELVNLPKPGLEIMPVYGISMEPTIRTFLNSLRDSDGVISQKWAEFSVSMVGTLNKSNAVHIQPNVRTTFDLNYKYDQKRMLMRKNIDNYRKILKDSNETVPLKQEAEDIYKEVNKVLCEIMVTVEISLNQDKMYTGEDDRRPNAEFDCTSVNSNNNYTKEKVKKRYCELDRLDVTVIRLPENAENNGSTAKTCRNSYCALGCICESLNCPVIVKGHCGRLECMFKCKCDFSRYKKFNNYDSVSSDLIPGLLKLDNEMNSKLAKEEKEFHQTVVLSGDKSILLKSQKRNWKASTKYSDFYKTMSLKINKNIDRDLFVVVTKIKCDNVEPWCMVHHLYKCFCKGRFVDSVGEMEVKHLEAPVDIVDDGKLTNSESTRSQIQTRPQRNKPVYTDSERKRKVNSDSLSSTIIDLDSPIRSDRYSNRCARSQEYGGRKYSNRYYQNMNHKIREMEKDDHSLHKKLKTLINFSEVDANNTSNIVNIAYEQTESKRDKYSKSNHITDELYDAHVPKKSKNSDTSGVSKIFKNVATASERTEHQSREETPELNADHIRDNILSGGFSTTDIEDSNKGKLVAWLEYSYKQYKKRCDLGLTKLTLQAPQPKKMALLPWNFILDRYKERKNLFLVSNQKPFRMFMAVNRDHPFLQDCINIDDIRFADLYIYPVTVKKLITNATDLKDSFCILCGHAYCWELIGSVTKVEELNNEDNLHCETSICNDKSLEYSQNENSCTESEPPITFEDDEDSDAREPEQNIEKTMNHSESSKWFVMTIENDFCEIQFFNRGFFVKYCSIIKAINVARFSKKTVRLSSQKCADSNSNSQFGIYAIPNANENCVFVGPYECTESLGIETVRSMTYIRPLKRTRGYWITTNKIDNINVIDNPMSFMPAQSIKPKEILSLQSKPNEKKDSFSSIEVESEKESRTLLNKTNSKSIKQMKSNKPSNSLLRMPTNTQKNQEHSQSEHILVDENTEEDLTLTAPVCTEISSCTSDLKINNSLTSIQSDSTLTKLNSDFKEIDLDRKKDINKTEKSMFAILKPEEINKRILDSNLCLKNDDESNNTEEVFIDNSYDLDREVEKDIENFILKPLTSNQNCNDDVFVISDDEECSDPKPNEDDFTYVRIKCKSVETLGWILAKQNDNKCLSFQFPGFNFSEYYPRSIAFKKINQILSRKIRIPSTTKLQWEVLSVENDETASIKLQSSDLGPNLVLTKQGPLRLLSVKTYSRKSKESADASEKIEST